MATLAAQEAAEHFQGWMRNTSEQRKAARVFPAEFSSYEEAHEEWLNEGGGLDLVGCDYDLAIETLLEVFVQRELKDHGQWPDLPWTTRLDSEARQHAWEHMTRREFQLAAFRRWHPEPSSDGQPAT